jgi:hypothetical protein
VALLFSVLDRGREDNVVEEVGNGEERGLDATSTDVLELVHNSESKTLAEKERKVGN